MGLGELEWLVLKDALHALRKHNYLAEKQEALLSTPPTEDGLIWKDRPTLQWKDRE